MLVDVCSADALVRGDEESRGAAGRVEDGLVFLRIDDTNDEVDDMARRAELPCVPLSAHDLQEVLEGVSEPFEGVA